MSSTQLGVTERIASLRERIYEAVPEIFADRARLVTESYCATLGIPYVLRRAKAFEHVLHNMDICIAPDELIAGSYGGNPRGCQVYPEYDMGFIISEMDTFDMRKADRFFISEETKSELRNMEQYWKNNTIADNALRLFSEEQNDCLSDLIFVLTALRSGVGHMIVDYPVCINKGLRAIIDQIEKLRQGTDINLPDFADRLVYYDAAKICCEAVIDFAHRFADIAEEQAKSETNPTRSEELLSIAENCRRVPEFPAENFLQALQSFWIAHLALHIESNGHSVSPGRFDQYMYPLYCKDKSMGVAMESLEEQLHALWLKFFEINKVRDKVSSVAFGGYPMFQNLIVGGQDVHGKSAVNELSHLCINATMKLRLPQPSLSARWFFGCEEDFLQHSLDCIALGTGMPALFNDEALIPNMLQMGYSLEEARDYGVVGCTETTGQGNAEPWLTGGFLNTLKVLELTIFDGYDPISRRQHDFHTGPVEEMKSFEEFFEAYIKQLFYYMRQIISCDNMLDTLHARLCPTPFESVLIRNCLNNGKTSLEGGAKHNATTLEFVGVPNVADSLAAIDMMIYAQSTLNWQQMKEALLAGYKGYEALQARLLNMCPKYGNDDERVDGLSARVLDRLFEEIKKYRSPRGGDYRIALYSIATHVLFASKTGATPDGRGIGEVLADGGVSCAHGRDKQGLTALLNSVIQLDPSKALGSTLLNVKLSPSLFLGESRKKLTDVLKTYFLSKGQHIQFNVFDVNTLRDAQRNPEKYPTLMVRVAGFSVLFTAIDKALQEDIITRTMHLSGGTRR
jgi:pyruvate formate-lyase/glycerol dehydratase family glycyl radical enzyme